MRNVDIETGDWLPATEAAVILSENSGRPISQEYLRRLKNFHKWPTRRVGARLCLYPKSVIEAYRVEARPHRRKRKADGDHTGELTCGE